MNPIPNNARVYLGQNIRRASEPGSVPDGHQRANRKSEAKGGGQIAAPLTPQPSEELDRILTEEMHDVARKAQVDYVAVNHPNGIRFGKTPQLLASFISANVERAKAAILATHIPIADLEQRLIDVEFVGGVEGPHLALSNKNGGYRLSGPKAWGSGNVIHSFTVSLNDLIRHAIRELYSLQNKETK